jgi:hypothetical protein
VSNWKAERDAFVSETMAFVEAVRSQRPISTEAVVAPRQLPLGVPEAAPTVSAPREPPARNRHLLFESIQLCVMTSSASQPIYVQIFLREKVPQFPR